MLMVGIVSHGFNICCGGILFEASKWTAIQIMGKHERAPYPRPLQDPAGGDDYETAGSG